MTISGFTQSPHTSLYPIFFLHLNMGLRMHMRVDTSAVVRVQVSVRCKARRRTKRLGEREIFSDAIYARTASDARLSLPPPARSCDRMLGVHAHSPHDTSRTSARGSCGRHRRSPLRPRSTHTPAMPSDATGGWPCLHPPCASSRAHHPALYSAHGHMQRRAYMRALAHVYMHNVAYAHSTSRTRSRSDTLVRTRAHAHAGISQERHTQTHTCTHMHTLPTYTHTHMNTHRHTNEHARTHTYTQTFVCMCDMHMHMHMHTHATHVLTHTCLHTHVRLYVGKYLLET